MVDGFVGGLSILFSWPTIGYVLAGCVMGSSVLLVFGNLLADFALIALDPRTRSQIRDSIR